MNYDGHHPFYFGVATSTNSLGQLQEFIGKISQARYFATARSDEEIYNDFLPFAAATTQTKPSKARGPKSK